MAIKINGNTVIDDSQNFTSTGTVSATGNITGQNIKTSGTVSATGNISANNLIAISNVNSNVVSAQTVSTNSVLATGTISAQSNVIGGNVISNGTISAGGNVNIAGNISAGGTITASFVNGNVTGNLQAPGNVGEIPFKNPNGYFTANINMSFDQTNAAFFAEKIFCGNGGFGTPAGITTMDIGNTNPTTIVMGGRATTINIGNTAGTTRIAGNLSITGNLLPAAILSSSQISTSGNITANIVNAANLQNTGLLSIVTSSGNIAMEPAGNVVLNNKNINNVAEPTQDNDVATKVYVDRVATTGLAFHTAVTVATTANLATTTGGTISYTQPNGPGNGVAAKITTTGSFTTIDTANVQTVGTRILVKNEGNAVLNGVYTWANSTSIVRSTDADEYGSNSSEQLSVNDYFFVSGGNVNLGSAYVVDAPQGTIIFGTSNIQFAQFSQSQVYSANTSAGLNLVGQTFNAKVDGVTTAFDGNGNIIVKASANLTTPNIGAATGTSLSTTGTVTGGNLLTAGLISSTGTITSADTITGANITTAGFISSTGNVNAGNLRTGGFVSAAGNVIAGNLTTVPSGNVSAGNVLTTGLISATGNITGNYILGNGSQLTGIDATSIQNGNSNVRTFANGNVTVSSAGVANVLNVTSTGTITTGTGSVTGNVTAGNILTAGLISATGNATAGNILTAGLISATGTATVGNLATAGTVSATGNVTAGNVLFGAGIVSGTGNVTANTFRGNLVIGNTNINNVNQVNTDEVYANTTIQSYGNTYTRYEVRAGGPFAFNGIFNAYANTQSSPQVQILGNVGSVSAVGNITSGNILTAGIMSSTGNGIHGNVLTGGLISATSTITSAANITGGNILTAGRVSATGDVTSAGNLSITGNIVDANALTISTSTGDITLAPAGNVNAGTKYINNVINPVQNQDAATKSYVDGLVSTSISYHTPVVAATTANLATTTGGTITYAQPGGAGNGIGATITTTGSFNLIDTANVQSANTRILVKDEGNAALNGVYVWSNATTITRSTDTNTSGVGNVNALGLNDYFFVSSGNINKGSAYVVNAPAGTITFGTSNITFAQFSNSQTYTANTSAGINLVGTVINAKIDGVTTAFDVNGNIIVKASANLTTPNIGAATGTSLSVTGAVNAATTISATGNITGGNILTAGIMSSTGNGIHGNILTAGIMSSTGNGIHGNVLTGGLISATGAITGAAITGSSLTVSTGNVSCGNIVNTNANGVGNIGSTGTRFNQVFALASSAQYADLAEKYTADATYESGTVVSFGGTQEVTISSSDADPRVAGVISTNPSFRMNDALESEHTAMVALTGRVPTKVTGTVRKGDLMVSAGNGVARAETNPQVGTVIGKALADHDGAEGTIEVVVGRF